MGQKVKFVRFLLQIFNKFGWATKAYLCIRIMLIPQSVFAELEKVAQKYQSIIDIGCGYGIVSLYFCFLGYRGKIYGLDIDKKRIDILKSIVKNNEWDHIQFEVRDFIKEGFSGLENYQMGVMIDILHHLDTPTQYKLLEHLSHHIPFLFIKDIDIKPRRKYYRNYFHDRVLMNNAILSFLGSHMIKRICEGYGYNTNLSFPYSNFPYPHYLLICKNNK